MKLLPWDWPEQATVILGGKLDWGVKGPKEYAKTLAKTLSVRSTTTESTTAVTPLSKPTTFSIVIY